MTKFTKVKARMDDSKLTLRWMHLGKIWAEFFSCVASGNQYCGSCSWSSVRGGLGLQITLRWMPERTQRNILNIPRDSSISMYAQKTIQATYFEWSRAGIYTEEWGGGGGGGGGGGEGTPPPPPIVNRALNGCRNGKEASHFLSLAKKILYVSIPEE